MSRMQVKGYQQARMARMQIVAELVLRHYTVRQVRAEVMKRLGLKTYSTSTVQSDIQAVLEELRQERLDNAEYALQLELERIDDSCRELWAEWELSKEMGKGNVACITELRQQLMERRKLLGLYAPEKREVKRTDEEGLSREELTAELRRLELITGDDDEDEQ